LILQHTTIVDQYTLREIWNAILQKEIAEIFGSITLILAFVRVLDL